MEKVSWGYNYSMEGVPVEEADSEKDLGVTFTTDLKLSLIHISEPTRRTPSRMPSSA